MVDGKNGKNKETKKTEETSVTRRYEVIQRKRSKYSARSLLIRLMLTLTLRALSDDGSHEATDAVGEISDNLRRITPIGSWSLYSGYS